MKPITMIIAIAALLLTAVGCSSGGDSNTSDSPKGNKPETVNAPPGAKNPEERGMAEQKAGDQDGGANK